MSVKTSKPSFASIAATGGASANLKSMLSSPNSITATTGHTSPSTNAPHSITTEHVDRKTGGAYKITKYRDNTSVAGGFTKLGCSGGNSDSKRSSSNRSTPSVPHSQQRTPSPPTLSAKPSNLAARRAAAQSNAPELNSTGSFRKPLAPIAINAPGLLRSELSPASFGSMPHSGGLSPSPTGVTAGRRSPYERPLPSPTNVSPHIASAYYTQSANKGSATYNEDGELEMEEEEAQYMASSSSPFGPPSPMALPAGGLPSSDPNVEMLLAYQTMLAQPSHSGAASNTASLASAYLKYLEAQANFNHFVNSTLEQTAATSNAMPMPSSAAPMPAVSLASAAPHLSPEVMAALAQQEQIAAQALKRRPMGMSNPASSPRRPSVSPAPDASSSPASLFGNVHQTPASSFRYGNRNNAIGSNISPTSSMPLPLPFPAAAAGTPCSPSTWSSRPYGTGAGTNVLATPFSPFDGHPNRYLLSATSTPYTATPGAVSASSSAYSSPLPSPASSTSSLPESDMMRRTESMQSSDSYTSYGSSASGRDVFDSDEKERFAKMAKYGYGGMGSGADTAAAAATAAGQWVSDADWSSNWRRRGPLDYVEPGSLLNLNSSPLGRSASTHSNLHQDFDLGLGKLRLGYPHDMGPTSMATSVSMPGAPLSKSIGLPAMLGEGMRSLYQPKAVGGNRKAALPPTPTLLGQDFVDGLMRTGYSEDESEQQHQQQEQQQQGSLSSGVKASLRASPNMAASPNSNTVLGLSGLQVLNPMAHLDLETPLASNVARF
ncbi:unnamed protein product [Tilletia controversa]|uniref:Uncharacterized protein n=3 Tax=Tilletia TaxID=13289 RepID=A0A8X7MTI4_9BASI|nr:hypothetical protein CF336_g4590 [Tilletia laevis]KAE8197404.1 hypothetical protein CF328_g3857 [Tilletia controversa]KAE8260209.1 hypothetical protein A4X03_0g3883 [Tilletia caries]KAE8201109.1 hypothetical protein CF335_g3810 [Tilletia laevis]KAE8247269.1 hypothetical protein A4X06_0g4580 [Tilletia controversa]